jgi:hypothetical protein
VHRLLAVFLLSGCWTDGGNRDETYKCSSPDHRHVAIFLTEWGGGAAGYAYEYVYVRDSVGDQDRVLSLKGGYDVRLSWLAPMHLRIEYPDSARVDHWQSWFGRMGDGRVEVDAVPSSGGKLIAAAGGCTS